MNLPDTKPEADAGRSPPTSLVDWIAETIVVMTANGAKLPFVVEHGASGSIVIMELSQHPIASKHPARWNAAEWAAEDKSRLLTGMLDAWERMHTALAADQQSDPDAMMVLIDAKEALLDAANDFCAEIAR